MPAAYPQQLRDRVLAACDQGQKTRHVARRFMVSSAWVRRLKQRRREHGETAARPMGGFRGRKVDLDALAASVAEKPDRTLAEHRATLGGACSASAIGRGLHQLGLTFKKRRSARPSKTARTSPAAANVGDVSNPS